MAKRVNITPSIDYGASRLNQVARKIVSLAFRMGGTPVDYYRAVQCNYTFPNGTSCWNPKLQTATVGCPVCGGTGAYYVGPVKIPAIFIDTRGNVVTRKHGLVYKDTARLVVPPIITPSIVKFAPDGEGGEQLQLLRDKFVIRNHKGEIDSIFYINSEPKDTWLAGTLYYSFDIIINTPNESNTAPLVNEYEPKLIYHEQRESYEILADINEEILNLREVNDVSFEDGRDAQSEVFDGEMGSFIPTSLLDDWKGE